MQMSISVSCEQTLLAWTVCSLSFEFVCYGKIIYVSRNLFLFYDVRALLVL
jgi:hypothetical protein